MIPDKIRKEILGHEMIMMMPMTIKNPMSNKF